MQSRQSTGTGLILFSTVAFVVVSQLGCAALTEEPDTSWPTVEIEEDVPSEVEGSPRLQRGGDGLLYSVGEFEETPANGEAVFGRHGGEWPLEESEPPALFYGEVAEVVSDRVVRVHPQYQFPGVEAVGLAVEFADARNDESLGKGMGRILDVDRSGPTHLQLNIGRRAGIQEGDMYGVVAPRQREGLRYKRAQLTRQLRGVCLIVETEQSESQCRLWRGHPDHALPNQVRSGQAVTFLEPGFGTPPGEATVLVAPTGDEQVDDWIGEHLDNYLSRFPRGNVSIEFFDESVDATDEDFHRWNQRIDREEPTLLVGASLESQNGGEQLVVNYTGVGSRVGVGMVAAPPEGGVDMGEPDEIEPDDWRGFAAILMGAAMVYRGQNAEALMHLHQALRDPAIDEEWRWHGRDQYAMRWAAMDRFEEALWLVHEDEAVATENDDDRAYYNALGTRVRFHDRVGQPHRALQLAREYLQWRGDDRNSGGYVSALAMLAEMALKAGEFDRSVDAVDELFELCTEGCHGDLIPLLGGVYWAAEGDGAAELQDRIVDRMVQLGSEQADSSLAAARMFQGWTFMRDQDLDQALIAFLEARRLYEQEGTGYGAARADLYLTLTQVGRGEAQDAFERGMQALEFMTEAGDYDTVVRIYNRLAQLYVEIDTSGPPQEYLGAARSVLQTGMRVQMATGDYARAAEAGFSYGHFLFRIGQIEPARRELQRAVTRGLRVARFDTVARCHLFLAIIARNQGDLQGFEQELQRAETMAEIADDPHIDRLIEDLRSPSEQAPTEDPTQLL